MHTETYLALGEFVVEFSRLLHYTESATILMIAPPLPPSRVRWLVYAAMSDRTAAPIIASYFSVFHEHWRDKLTPKDVEILRRLRSELDDVVTERNRLMHDAWLPVSKEGGIEPSLYKTRYRAHGAGLDVVSEPYLPSQVQELTEKVRRLTELVRAAVSYQRPGQQGPELHLRMEIRSKQVHPLGA